MKNVTVALQRVARPAGRCLLLLALLLPGAFRAVAQQNVGIGTTAPTQTLDVNGQLRVRGLNGSDTRLPVVLPDGTLGVNAPVYGTTAITPAVPTSATGSVATGTNPISVAASGTTAYVVNFSSSSLQVFNVATPSAPVLLATVTTGANPRSVAVSGPTAYVVNQNGNTLQVFNVATPSAPVLLGTVATGTNPISVAVSGTTAYVVNQTGSLQVFNVATPSAPVLLGTVATGSYPNSVAVSGTTAYVVNLGSNTLQVFNVATPSAPVLLATVTTGSQPFSVAVSGTTAYVVNSDVYGSSLQVFNVATPSAPVLLATAATGYAPHGVAVSGTTAYVLNFNNNTLQAFNVATPSAPVLLGTVVTGTNPNSVAVSGTTAYVVNSSNALQAFVFPGPPRAVAVNADGSLASVALPSGADFIRNGTTPQAASNFNLSGAGTVSGLLTAGSAKITNLTTAGVVTTDASGNLGSATATSLDATTASNGLTKVGTDIRLGGTLAAATTIVQGGNAFSLTGGNVGIGTSAPTGLLEVAAPAVVSVPSVDQSQTTQNTTFGYTTFYQSFTAGVSGQLRQLATNVVGYNNSSSTGTTGTALLEVFAGATPGSTALASQSVSFGAYTADPVPPTTNTFATPATLTAGQVYCFRMTLTGGPANFLFAGLCTTNCYAGGSASTNGWDAAFQTLMSTTVAGVPALMVQAAGVGIGTTAPSQKLEVAGTIYSTSGGFKFPDGTTQATAAAAPNLTGDITSTGAVTTYNNVVPATKGGAGAVSGILKANGTGTVAQAGAADFPTLNQNTTGNAATVTTNANLTGDISSVGNATTYATNVPNAKGGAGTLTGLLKATSGTVAAAVAGTDYAAATGSTAYVQNNATATAQSASFNVSGNGTIGGSSTVAGAVQAGTNLIVDAAGANTGNTTNILRFGAAGTTSGEGIGSKRNSTGNQYGLDFYTSSINRMSISVAGNVGIGNNNPGVKLDVASSDGTQLNLTSTSTDPNGVISINIPATNTGCNTCSELIVFNKVGGGQLGNIGSNLGGNAVTYNTTSDKRLKEHIGRTRFGLADLLKLEVKDYNFIGSPAANRVTGFLAQDLFKVYPDAVKEGDYGPTVTNQWAVDYGRITPLLVQAIQDQQALIDALKARAATAETRAAAFEGRAAQAEADHASLLTLQAQVARLLGEGAQATK